MPGFPSAQPHLALNGLALFGLELTVVCAFQPPPVFSPSPRCLPGAGGGPQEQREGPSVGGRIVKWPLFKHEKVALKFAFFGASGNYNCSWTVTRGVRPTRVKGEVYR